MARLDNPFLMSLVESTPEWQAGLIPKDLSGDFFLENLYEQPTGPLYNVDVERSDLESPLSKFEVYDPDRQKHLETYGKRSGIEKASEKQLEHGLNPEMFTGMTPAINTFYGGDRHGFTRIDPLTTAIGIPGAININAHLADLVGTRPTSPRNSELINTLYGPKYPEDINREMRNTVRHEIGHGVNQLAAYKDSTDAARALNMNEVFGNYMNPHPSDSGNEYTHVTDLSQAEKEELFNRAKDAYEMENSLLGIGDKPVSAADMFIMQALAKFDTKGKYSKEGLLGIANQYKDKVSPQVKQHFDQMEFEKQQRAANRGEGYYGHKDYKGGFAGNVTQKGPGRSKDDRMAMGGLIDLYRYGGFI
jgi:hypothetical protein